MAKAIDSSKHIMAGLLILSFLLLILIASRQILKKPVDDAKGVNDKKEGFQTTPTRAAKCKCLPGYVPTKIVDGGFFVRLRGDDIPANRPEVIWYNYVNMKTKISYELGQSWSGAGYTDARVREIWGEYMRNIPIRNMDFYRDYGPFVRDNGLQYGGGVEPWTIGKVINTTMTETNYYQCVNLYNMYDVKPCY